MSLDSHFGHFKRKIEDSGTYQWGSCFVDTLTLVQEAVSSLPRTTVTTPLGGVARGRKRFRIPQIQSLHRFEVEKNTGGSKDSFTMTVEGSKYIPQVEAVKPTPPKVKTTKYQGESTWVADLQSNCERLRKQRRKLESYNSAN